MATNRTIPGTIDEFERTFHVDRLTPEGGAYQVRVYREVYTIVDDVRIARREEQFVEPVSTLVRRVCFRDYLATCQRAKGMDDLVAGESKLYDDLVAEIRAERAQAKADA